MNLCIPCITEGEWKRQSEGTGIPLLGLPPLCNLSTMRYVSILLLQHDEHAYTYMQIH